MVAYLDGIFFSASSILITVGALVGGIGQDALAANKFVEAGMVLGHGVSSLFCGAVGSDCSFRLLSFLGIVTAWGIWVVAMVLTTVGLGSAGKVGSMGKGGLLGIGWAITLTLNFLFTGALDLYFFSTFLGTRVFFMAKSFCHGKWFWCVVVIGVGGQACLLVLSTFSSFLSGMDRDGALCSRGCMI